MSIDTTIDEQEICDKCNQVMNYMGVLSKHDVWKCFACVIVKEVMIK